jgi:ElaB/YqjD/DUF883 family membrane-anchored ribosome-binding protein
MSHIESQERALLIQRLTEEIRDLSEQQNALLQKAAFVKTRDDEAKTYRGRARRIAKLVKQLEGMNVGDGCSRGGHREQKAQETARHG